jgi:NADPH:quinone reductase-like Zn-dependent oxidoreductase
VKAIVQHAYGSADVLELRDIDPPEIGDDEVLIRVRAAGVDRGVWHIMTGLPYLVRILGYGFRAPKMPVRGYDVAGRIEAVGAKVTTFRQDDEVFGLCDGSYAEFACAQEDKVALKPQNLSFEQAAAVPTSALTALQGLRDHGNVQAGQTVLIIGASGGVGTYAVQLAKDFGAEVTGVCSTAKVDLVLSIGADHVIDYTRDDIAVHGRHYDLILDIGGNRSLTRLRRALTPRGTLVIVGGEGGGRWIGGVDRQLRGLMLSPFVGQRLRSFIARVTTEDLEALKEYMEAGTVTPVIDTTFPLESAAEALQYLEDGRATGKIVISLEQNG